MLEKFIDLLIHIPVGDMTVRQRNFTRLMSSSCNERSKMWHYGTFSIPSLKLKSFKVLLWSQKLFDYCPVPNC